MKGPMRVACLLVFGSTILAAGCQAPQPEGPKGCDFGQTNQRLSGPTTKFTGSSLADKQLALTFDDGPGARTSELSAWLKEKNIRATFFINGVNVPANPGVLQKVVADGHVIANHTQTHAHLPQIATDADIVKEVADTDAIIAPLVPTGRLLFRAPYGEYDTRVFNLLEASAMKKYVGHVEWDVGEMRTATTAADWACWNPTDGSPKLTTQQCGDLYRQEIAAKKKGIVLMHDPFTGTTGNTVDMVKYMVPLLIADGYTFKNVDEIPDIAAKLPPLPTADAGADSGKTDDSKQTTLPPSSSEAPPSRPPHPCE
jgi:peptidoglycan-N-acetylglucosamine deacetylase